MSRWRVRAGFVGAALIVALLANAGWRWWHNRPPYGPELLAAAATLELVSYDDAAAALAPQAAPVVEPGDQLALGRVTWRPPPEPQEGGTFWIAVLDKRNHLLGTIQAVTSARHDEVGLGSHGHLQRAVDRYPWLRGIAGREVDGQWWSGGNSAFVSAVDAAPVTFAAVFRSGDHEGPPSEPLVAGAPMALSDLLVALISMGPDGQIYWAERLLG